MFLLKKKDKPLPGMAIACLWSYAKEDSQLKKTLETLEHEKGFTVGNLKQIEKKYRKKVSVFL